MNAAKSMTAVYLRDFQECAESEIRNSDFFVLSLEDLDCFPDWSGLLTQAQMQAAFKRAIAKATGGAK